MKSKINGTLGLSKSIFVLYYIFIFCISPVYFFFFYQPVYDFKDLILAEGINIVPLFILLKIDFVSSVESKIDLNQLLLFCWISIFLLIIYSISTIDLDNLRINRDASRKIDFRLTLLNLHVVLFFLATLLYHSVEKSQKKWILFLIIISGSISFFIGYTEGRRTAVIIPFVISVLFSFISNRRNLVLKSILYLGALLSLFYLVTMNRISQSHVSYTVIFEVIINRLFNPGNMSLVVIKHHYGSFNPHLFDVIIERLKYIYGFQKSYIGVGNPFGRFYGLLSSQNFVVAINPGVVLENYLQFKYFYCLVIYLYFKISFYLIKTFGRIIYGGDIIITILICHAFQMETGYFLGLLSKLFLAAQIYLLFEFLIRPYFKSDHLNETYSS